MRNAGEVNELIGFNNSYGIDIGSCSLTAQEISEFTGSDIEHPMSSEQSYLLKDVLDRS